MDKLHHKQWLISGGNRTFRVSQTFAHLTLQITDEDEWGEDRPAFPLRREVPAMLEAIAYIQSLVGDAVLKVEELR